MCDPFLMKKLIKNEICGSVNSAYMHCSLQKVNICGYCSLNSNRNTPKRVKKKKKKKKKKRTKRSWKRRRGIQTVPLYLRPFLSIYFSFILLFYIHWDKHANVVIFATNAVLTFFIHSLNHDFSDIFLLFFFFF